ncbi:MAG TPA: hypothetical protein VGR06_43510 [Actinophytocola sp.]|jgi:hypothetical protein|uniref:hypothetical protein n=1 Tax=Actinophytocola sp. TaxID=1872138 RepID=UPI002E08A516|nr:hypothetical protein [Actinophytocola sp.]
MDIFRGITPNARLDSAEADAAAYPEIVALTQLLVTPYWRHQAMVDNLTHAYSSDAAWRHLREEITAGRRHWDDIPDPIRVAAAGLLREGPALARFITEVRRAVEPDYRWNPWPYYRRFDPLVRSLMDELEIHRRRGTGPLPQPRTGDARLRRNRTVTMSGLAISAADSTGRRCRAPRGTSRTPGSRARGIRRHGHPCPAVWWARADMAGRRPDPQAL